ncbi:MAG TPA: lipid-A-disaccharide synthase N-terminal domain-containing protein [Candidatus Omnitrophota bacterium]|nr:lipid-A-disaccharide synthase N-terminal domain-containing protein [Candidatus Omnitrophota bacterium]
MNETIATWLLVLGFTGQIIFGSRFLIQWICSEIKKESHIPIAFWYLSLCGGCLLLVYALFRKDPVFILGQSTGIIVYTRNLILISRKRNLSQEKNV